MYISTKNTLNEKNTTKQVGLNNFFYDYRFPLIVSLLVLLFWICNLQLLGLSVIVLFASIILVRQKDFTPLLPILLMAPMVFREMDVFKTIYPVILFAIIGVCLIVNFIRFPLKIKKFGFMEWSFVLLAISMLLGGVGSGHLRHYVAGLPHVAFLSVAMLAEYVVIRNRVNPPSFIDFKKYLCWIFIVATNLACAQLLYARAHIALHGYKSFPMAGSNIGWANTIHFGYLILLSLPLCCYLLVSTKKYFLPLSLEVFFLYFSAFATKSDGTIGLLFLITPILIIYVFKNIPNQNYLKFKILICVLVFMFSICELLFALYTDLSEFTDKILNVLKDDNKRSEIYRVAIRMFKRNPIFGAGFGCGFVAIVDYTGYFHSTLFHTLANLGIFGLLSYIVFYIARFSVLTKKHTVFNFMAVISFFTFAAFAMIDNGEFHFLVIYSTALVASVEVANKKDNDKPLPLFNNRHNQVNRVR